MVQSTKPKNVAKTTDWEPHLPLSVLGRLSKLSSNQKIFDGSIPRDQEALIKAGCNHKLTYQKHDQKKDNTKQRKRKIIWFTRKPDTELSNEFSKIKDNKRSAKITWKILGRPRDITQAVEDVHCA